MVFSIGSSHLSGSSSFSSDLEEEDEETDQVAKKKKPKKKKKKKVNDLKGVIVIKSDMEHKKKKTKKLDEIEEKKVEEVIPTVTSMETAVTPEPDILGEINRMKALAEGRELEVEEIKDLTITKKEKKKKKKKRKKKKIKLTKKMAEKLRIEAEEEAKRKAEEERLLRIQERKDAIKKEVTDQEEQLVRQEQLAESCEVIDNLIKTNIESQLAAKVQHEWELYVNCGPLPIPSKCDAMNTYLHLWESNMENTSMEEASKRTADVIKLLEDLDDLIDTVTEEEKYKIDNWEWIKVLFREHQKRNLDIVTYNLLRNVRENLNRIDTPTADFNFKDDYLTLCLWLKVQLPVPLPNPRLPPKPRIEIIFTDLDMTVYFPETINCEYMAIRAMYLKYDHLSDLCDFYKDVEIPSNLNIDLYTASVNEFKAKLQYKYDNRTINTIQVKPEGVEEQEGEESEMQEIELPLEDLGAFEGVPLVTYKKLNPSASQHAISVEESQYAELRQSFVLSLPNDVINLRKFAILGGIYYLHLLLQPPQPQEFITMELTITPLSLPKHLEKVPFYEPYTPPEPPEAGVKRLPEDIEAEIKQQEEELDKLILVTLKWPDNVIFLELPVVCHWDKEQRLWTSKEVFDLKHNEEKGIVTFRTGRLGTFALATYKYANLPFQAWDIKPEANGSVTFQITTAILMLEFNVKDGLICISQLQNSPNVVLEDKVGVYFQLHHLKRIMQESGIDIFPAFDAFCYLEVGTCEKHWPMEKHLYYNIATLSICFNFSWSRWNLTVGRRKIVLQMRQYVPDKMKQKNHLMLLVTPQKANFIDCTEVSQSFSEEDVMPNVKFCADLYHLMKSTTVINFRNKIENASIENVYALSQLLIATRVLSFS